MMCAVVSISYNGMIESPNAGQKPRNLWRGRLNPVIDTGTRRRPSTDDC